MEYKSIQTMYLRFDPNNPRFYKLDQTLDETSTIDEMLEDEGVQELMLSIGSKGYFPGEPILVMEQDSDGKHMVVEGNRRLTAVKLLNGEIAPPKRKQRGVESIIQQSPFRPDELPCIICNDIEEVNRYIGFRHVRGVKEWDALSKAIYVKRLLGNIVDSISYKEKLKMVANEIGSKPAYLSRLQAALALYDMAKSEEFFQLKLRPQDIEFSLITTALSYADICSWLGVNDLLLEVAPQVDKSNLAIMLKLLFVVRSDATTVIKESRQLREFSHIVRDEQALIVLETTGDVDAAHIMTGGPSEALTNFLEKALNLLRQAWRELGEGRVNKVHDTQIELARQSKKQSNNILNFMENMDND